MKKLNLFITIILLLTFTLVITLLSKDNTIRNKYGKYTLNKNIGKFIGKSRNIEFEIKYDKPNNQYIVTIEGRTKGWISIGFDRTDEMKDSEIVIAYIKDGKTEIAHHYATGKYKHEPIKSDKKVVSLIKSEEKDGKTKIIFSRKLGIKTEQLKELKPGSEIEILYALGKKDNFRTKHNERGHIKIRLPK